MTPEVTTQVEVPPPTEVVEAPPTEAVETPAEETKPAAEPVEPAPDPYDELEHERFKPVLERRDRRVEAKLQEDYQRQYEEATGNWKSTEAHKQLAGIYGNILQKMEDGDAIGQERLIDRLEAAIEPYKESYITAKRTEGAQKAAADFFQIILGSLDHKGQDEFQDYLVTNKGASWGDILKKRDELREGKTKDKITSLEAQIESLKARARPEGPDTTAKGGGGGDDNKRLLDPSTSIEEIMQIRARQRAGS